MKAYGKAFIVACAKKHEKGTNENEECQASEVINPFQDLFRVLRFALVVNLLTE
jgi:hypothetical protein